MDGPTAEIHDGFRRVADSFDRTIQGARWAREIDLSVQINTTITRQDLKHMDAIIALLEELDIALWSVFFPVLTGRGNEIPICQYRLSNPP
jgi:AdoMet-dependent heme synthase